MKITSPHVLPQLLRSIRVGVTLISVSLLFVIIALGQEPLVNDISTYITELKSQDKLVRKRAAEALSQYGPSSRAALPNLEDLLSDQDEGVRLAAVKAIGTIGLDAREASPKLLSLFADSSRDVRLSAADAFVRIGQSSPEALSTVIKLLQDDKATVRESAAYSISQFQSEVTATIPQLLALLDNDPSEQVRTSAAYTLGTIGSRNGVVIPALIKALSDKDVRVKIQASQSLANIGGDAKVAIPDIVRLLDSQNVQLRAAVVGSLGTFGPEAKDAVPILVRLLKDTDVNIRKDVVQTIGSIGPEAKDATHALVELLTSPDPEFRGMAANAIANIGPEAKEAIPHLMKLFSDEDERVRKSAIYALGSIGPNASVAVPELIKLLDAPEGDIRESAAYALGGIGSASKEAVPKLISLLGSTEEKDRCGAAYALGMIGADAKDAIRPLSDLLKAPQNCVRKNASYALRNMGSEVKLALPNLIESLEDSDSGIRLNAAQALGKLGADAKASIPALIKRLNDSDYYVREGSAESLINISTALAGVRATDSLSQLREVHLALKNSPYPEMQSRADQVKRSIDVLEALNIYQIKQWAHDHLYITIALGIVLWVPFALLICYLLLRLRPLWLFRINESIPDSLNFKIVENFGEIKLPFKFFLVIGFFHYHPKVLDAWVSKYIDIAKEEFERLDTVRSRNIHVDAPVIFEGKTLSTLSAKLLSPIFNKNRICLLIWGEGGSGKTSLACQIARWAMEQAESERLASHLMIPILLDQDVHHSSTTSVSAFTESVRGALQILLGQSKAVSIELTEHLLRSKRIMVIADHLSEMSDMTRQIVNPAWVDFPAAALVVTSRINERLNGVPRVSINPLRIEGKRLSSFMEAYLIQKGKRHLFNDPEFFNACSCLSVLVGERDITVLLARFYADQMVVTKEVGNGSKPPDNIPDLMLGYVIEANRSVGQDGLDSNTVISAVKQLAWACIRSTYQPTSIDIADAHTALNDGEHAKAIVSYLEHKLNVLQKSRAVEGYVRFVLDPLAEYLAAQHVIELYGNNNGEWREFITRSQKFAGGTQNVREFLLAVRDCCLVKGTINNTPHWLPFEIGQIVGLDPDIPQQNQGEGRPNLQI